MFREFFNPWQKKKKKREFPASRETIKTATFIKGQSHQRIEKLIHTDTTYLKRQKLRYRINPVLWEHDD